MNWDKHTGAVKFIGALLAIPAAAAGVYSAYHSYFSSEVACQSLRSSILLAMDKNIPADAKYRLLRRDVTEFERKCAASDPDALAIFQGTMLQLQAPAQSASTPAAAPAPQTVAAAAPTDAQPPNSARGKQYVAIFGLSTAGERRGWVPLNRRDQGKDIESNFDGYMISAPLPPAGKVLTARHAVGVWLEPQPPGKPDPARMQGRVAASSCVEVLATRAMSFRLWAEVSPADCR